MEGMHFKGDKVIVTLVEKDFLLLEPRFIIRRFNFLLLLSRVFSHSSCLLLARPGFRALAKRLPENGVLRGYQNWRNILPGLDMGAINHTVETFGKFRGEMNKFFFSTGILSFFECSFRGALETFRLERSDCKLAANGS